MEKLYGKQLEIMATKARLLGLDAVHTAASGHIGGSLSIADALAVLYNASLHKKRDRQPDMDGARRCAADALRRAAVFAHQSCFSLTAVFYSGSKKISLRRSSL